MSRMRSGKSCAWPAARRVTSAALAGPASTATPPAVPAQHAPAATYGHAWQVLVTLPAPDPASTPARAAAVTALRYVLACRSTRDPDSFFSQWIDSIAHGSEGAVLAAVLPEDCTAAAEFLALNLASVLADARTGRLALPPAGSAVADLAGDLARARALVLRYAGALRAAEVR